MTPAYRYRSCMRSEGILSVCHKGKIRKSKPMPLMKSLAYNHQKSYTYTLSSSELHTLHYYEHQSKDQIGRYCFWFIKLLCLGRLESQVVFALDFWTLVCYALSREFEPRCRQLFFGPKHNIYALFHDFYLIYLIWYYNICLSNLSLNCETEKGK